jgi:hypothetical protein
MEDEFEVTQDSYEIVYKNGELPDPVWIRGRCPKCGNDLISRKRYKSGYGYMIHWTCYNRLIESPTCNYDKVL